MTILDEFHRDEGRVLDRLVDGELSPSERRELLAALDDEPGAWRRCALAFLEAQTWRWQLSRVAAEPLVTHASSGAPRSGGAERRRFVWGWGLALAASLLVTFGLGTRFPIARQSQEGALARQDTDTPPSTQTPASPDVDTSEPADPATVANAEADPAESPWETLTLASADDADAGDQIQLRVLSSNEEGDDPAWTTGEQSSVSSRLLGELEEAGWEVNRRRRLVPIDLSDGRRMIVPVEEVDIRYPEVAKF